jgi:predicted transcriptional regulator
MRKGELKAQVAQLVDGTRTYAEIATLCGTTEASVYSAVHRMSATHLVIRRVPGPKVGYRYQPGKRRWRGDLAAKIGA